MAFTACTTTTNNIAALDDQPNDVGGLTAAQLKAKFDLFGTDFVAWFNATHLQELNPDLIINGGCKVHQRVAVPNLSTAYQFGIDRIAAKATGTAVSAGTITKNTSTNCGSSGTNLKLAGVTVTGTGIVYIRYRMEAKDAVEFKNKSVSIGCEAYQDTGGAINYTIYVRKANAADNFAAVTAISNSDAISVPNITATTAKYENVALGDCSNGLEIEIQAACGAVTTKNFEFADIRMNQGSKLAPFQPKSFEDELRACMRYYEKSYDYGVISASLNGMIRVIIGDATTQALSVHVRYKVTKRTTPTLTLYDGVSAANCVYKGGDGKAATKSREGDSGFSGGSADATSATEIAFQYIADAEL